MASHSEVLASMAMAAGLALEIIWGQARRGLAFSWGFLWFAAAYSPRSGSVIPADALVHEHCMYLPTVGIALGWREARRTGSIFNQKKQGTSLRCWSQASQSSWDSKTHIQNEVWQQLGCAL